MRDIYVGDHLVQTLLSGRWHRLDQLLYLDRWTTTTTTVLWPFVWNYPGEPVPEETLTHPPSWSSPNLYHLLPSTTIQTSSLFKLRAWQSFAQPLSMSSLVYLLVWSPSPHIPYISSLSQCLLFATHARTIATCFAVLSVLYPLDSRTYPLPHCS